MKKFIIIVLLIILCFILIACDTIKENYYGVEQEHRVIPGYYAIVETCGNVRIVYDMQTRIMYQIVIDGNRMAMSEYYINNNNNPEIAIYGYNYKGE